MITIHARTKLEAIEKLIEIFAKLENHTVAIMQRDDLSGDDLRTIRNNWIDMRNAWTREGLPNIAKQAQRRIDLVTDKMCAKIVGF